MKLTVFEQGAIPVASRASEEPACLGQAEAAGLVELGERMGARAFSWHRPTRLRVEQYVGVVQFGEVQIEILPKIEGLTEPGNVRQSLLGMLAVAEDLEVRGSEIVGYLDAGEPFVRALARLYCRKLLELARRGLRQEYLVQDDLLPFIRGKVDWPAHARAAVTQRLDFPCRYDERSEDTRLNRTLKAALVQAADILEGSRASKVVDELRHVMNGVTDVRPAAIEFDRVRTDRVSRQVAPLLELAKLILGRRNPDLSSAASGARRTYALVWDMNVLFEEYVGRVCRQVLGPKGFRVDLQERASAYLAVDTSAGRKVFLLRPDILLRQGHKSCAVADTKWKRLDPSEPHLGVSPADVYQMLAYARRFGVDTVLLVYPHHPRLGAPGLQREYVTEESRGQRVRVRIATVDLARLEDVPRQLELGFQGVQDEHAA